MVPGNLNLSVFTTGNTMVRMTFENIHMTQNLNDYKKKRYVLKKTHLDLSPAVPFSPSGCSIDSTS